MATAIYILRLTDGTQTHDISVNANGRVEVFDGATPYEIINVPDAPPPVGQFPVWDGAVQYLVPFTELIDTTYEGIANTIRTKFLNGIEAVEGLTTQYDNAPNVASWPGLYGQLAVEFGEATQIEIGNPHGFHVFGNAVASLRAPLEDGDGALLALADKIDAEFRGVTEREVAYTAPFLNELGADGPWWRVDLVVPFRVHRLETPAINGPYGVASATAAANAVRGRFDVQVGTPLGIPVQYDNAPAVEKGSSLWIGHRIEEPSFAAEIISGGLGTFRTPGNMIADLYAPVDVGDAPLLQVADTIDINFRSLSADGVVYSTPSVQRRGRTSDDMWWQVTVACPFYFDVAA